ncbi:MAG: flagellin [Planctomycetes bacterium SM23_25]|nr:MAG: flagellin [Planctomycetes bacterium DG_20]KPK49896.1 MAG: flagellin [Planctomycetes bacterium SM23_25]
MLAIKNNLMAENASRYLAQSYDALAKSVERLSSGLRINGAADDAAGLAVRELMRADIAVLRQGARNAQDGISMLQTAEGAMQVIDEALVRMKELAEQSATATYSDTQRAIMDAEFQEMANEIDRIAKSTTFNTILLLNDSAASAVNIQVGGGSTANVDYITVNKVDMQKTGLAIDTLDITSVANAQSALAAIGVAIEAKDSARASFGYKINRLENTVATLDIQAENLMTAESRISDVDVAKEMSTLTRNQVLAQAGVAMLAQANAMPQLALTLLR